jgi:AraC-like DNA-binding protein
VQVLSKGQVSSEKYSFTYERLNSEIVRMDRTLHSGSGHSFTDATARAWRFSIAADASYPWASVKRGAKVESLQGFNAVFIPSFSVVEWRVKEGRHRYEMIVSGVDLPPEVPKIPIAFRLPKEALPSSAEGVVELLRASVNEKMEIGRATEPSALSRRAKELLDRHFDEEVRIAEVARDLRCSHKTLIASFSKDFGLTPAEYRVKLRAYQAFFLLLSSRQPVTALAHDAGFNNLGLFNRQFRRQFGTLPSKIRPLGGKAEK